MKLNEIYKIKNNNYIVILPSCDLDIKEEVEYCFENVFFIDNDPKKEELELVVNYINDNLKSVILFDYANFYRNILPYIRKSKAVKWVIKDSIATLTDPNVRSIFSNLMEFCDRNIVTEIACLDYSTSEVLRKNGYNTKHILLDFKRESYNSENSNDIGILGNDYNPNHNVYNELSALKMVNYDSVKLLYHMEATEHFIDFFNIKVKKVETFEEVIKDNFVNLYCNFTSNNYSIVLKSLDCGVPILLGNTDLFDNYLILKEYLVLESDDDINEISNKITKIKENKLEILEEYNKFRNDFIKKSKDTIKDFLT